MARALTAFALTKGRIDAIMPDDVARWVLHDIRRAVASGLARLGINLPIIEKVVNVSGSFGGIVGVYQRHSFADEKRAAMAAWFRVYADPKEGHIKHGGDKNGEKWRDRNIFRPTTDNLLKDLRRTRTAPVDDPCRIWLAAMTKIWLICFQGDTRRSL